MRFTIPQHNNHGDGGSAGIRDQDGHIVGMLVYGKNSGRTVSILGKYKGHFQTAAECEAFVKGVAAVLNHMISDER